MKRVTFVLETFLGYDRPTLRVTEDWIRWRLDFFHNFTLRSLLNQTFKDFLIFVQIGERHKKIFDAYPWHPAVRICRKNGREHYAKIRTPFVCITRTDSDDLLHETAMAAVRDNVVLNSGRTVLAFKNNIYWDQLNKLIGPHRRSSTPFYTHIFPARIYRDWSRFCAQHFRQHGMGGAGDRQAKELPSGKVCVIKHGRNISHLKRGLPPFYLKEGQREQWAAYDEGIILSQVRMRQILKQFGVDARRVVGDA